MCSSQQRCSSAAAVQFRQSAAAQDIMLHEAACTSMQLRKDSISNREPHSARQKCMKHNVQKTRQKPDMHLKLLTCREGSDGALLRLYRGRGPVAFPLVFLLAFGAGHGIPCCPFYLGSAEARGRDAGFQGVVQ
mmetsp:Transcript_77361/g.129093  ORF Transcript_77361/g.129093 Transcript_77361/m.129093 type:complete len:134 (+) Transcript_77361:245-646(+)